MEMSVYNVEIITIIMESYVLNSKLIIVYKLRQIPLALNVIRIISYLRDNVFKKRIII